MRRFSTMVRFTSMVSVATVCLWALEEVPSQARDNSQISFGCSADLPRECSAPALAGVRFSGRYLKNLEVGSRDKTGTNGEHFPEPLSQVLTSRILATGGSFQAEGTGLEPATPFGAPHFQCLSTLCIPFANLPNIGKHRVGFVSIQSRGAGMFVK